MEKILRLNEQDIVQALADHFNVDRAKVNLHSHKPVCYEGTDE